MINPRNGLIAGAFAVLSVAAIAGWARKPEGINAQSLALNPQPISATEPCLPGASAANRVPVANSVPVGYQPAEFGAPYRDERYAPADYIGSIHRPVRVVSQQFVDNDPVVQDSGTRNSRFREDDSREVVTSHQGRSKKKSALIVAGSAGGGAAIGAIAGGGKGAGIGAVSGGAAGFIYDRLTHNR